MEARMSLSNVPQEYSFCACAVLGKITLYDGNNKLAVARIELDVAISYGCDSVCVAILPTVNTLIQRRGHYNAWKLLTSLFPVSIEMLRLMNKMSAKILNFWIG